LASDQIENYRLDGQIGFILRKVNQRHTGIFSDIMPGFLTPTRFAALAKLLEFGTLSQNALGRLTAMDIATIKGVVDRLRKLDMVESGQDPNDARRQLINLTRLGRKTILEAIPTAMDVSRMTTSPLSDAETDTLLKLLQKLS